MGRVEVNDRNGKSYVDIQRINALKRKTLAALYAKISDCVAFALKEQIEAETEEDTTVESPQEAASEEAGSENPE